MKLIVGLGNPGERYQNNRHNVGFMFVDRLLKNVSCYMLHASGEIKFGLDKYTESELCELEINKENVVLAKPQTFMNESGRVVKKLTVRYHVSLSSGNPPHAFGGGIPSRSKQISAQSLIIIHDDLDIRLGEYKIQLGKGPKLHNGIESIENHLGTKDFWRVRIGVDNRTPDNRTTGERYVLQAFKEDEKKVITHCFEKILIELNFIHIIN